MLTCFFPFVEGSNPGGEMAPCLNKGMALNGNFNTADTANYIIVFNFDQLGPYVGKVMRVTDEGLTWVANIFTPFDANYKAGLLVSANVAIWSDTISTTNTNLSGRVSGIAMYDIPTDIPVFADLAKWVTMPQFARINQQLSSGLVYIQPTKPRKYVKTGTGYLSADVAMTQEPVWENTVQLVPGGMLQMEAQLGVYGPRSRLAYRFTNESAQAVELTYDIGGNNTIANLNAGASTYEVVDTEDDQISTQIAIRVGEGIPIASIKVEVFTLERLFAQDDDCKFLAYIQGNIGIKNICMNGYLRYQLIPRVENLQMISMSMPTEFNPAMFEAFNLLVAKYKDCNIVMSREEYDKLASATDLISLESVSDIASGEASLATLWRSAVKGLKSVGIQPARMLKGALSLAGEAASRGLDALAANGYATATGQCGMGGECAKPKKEAKAIKLQTPVIRNIPRRQIYPPLVYQYCPLPREVLGPVVEFSVDGRLLDVHVPPGFFVNISRSSVQLPGNFGIMAAKHIPGEPKVPTTKVIGEDGKEYVLSKPPKEVNGPKLNYSIVSNWLNLYVPDGYYINVIREPSTKPSAMCSTRESEQTLPPLNIKVGRKGYKPSAPPKRALPHNATALASQPKPETIQGIVRQHYGTAYGSCSTNVFDSIPDVSRSKAKKSRKLPEVNTNEKVDNSNAMLGSPVMTVFDQADDQGVEMIRDYPSPEVIAICEKRMEAKYNRRLSGPKDWDARPDADSNPGYLGLAPFLYVYSAPQVQIENAGNLGFVELTCNEEIAHATSFTPIDDKGIINVDTSMILTDKAGLPGTVTSELDFNLLSVFNAQTDLSALYGWAERSKLKLYISFYAGHYAKDNYPQFMDVSWYGALLATWIARSTQIVYAFTMGVWNQKFLFFDMVGLAYKLEVLTEDVAKYWEVSYLPAPVVVAQMTPTQIINIYPSLTQDYPKTASTNVALTTNQYYTFILGELDATFLKKYIPTVMAKYYDRDDLEDFFGILTQACKKEENYEAAINMAKHQNRHPKFIELVEKYRGQPEVIAKLLKRAYNESKPFKEWVLSVADAAAKRKATTAEHEFFATQSPLAILNAISKFATIDALTKSNAIYDKKKNAPAQNVKQKIKPAGSNTNKNANVPRAQKFVSGFEDLLDFDYDEDETKGGEEAPVPPPANSNSNNDFFAEFFSNGGFKA